MEITVSKVGGFGWAMVYWSCRRVDSSSSHHRASLILRILCRILFACKMQSSEIKSKTWSCGGWGVAKIVPGICIHSGDRGHYESNFSNLHWTILCKFQMGEYGTDMDRTLWFLVFQSWCWFLYIANRFPLFENAVLASHVASVIGYPFHLIIYWYPLPLHLCFRIYSAS